MATGKVWNTAVVGAGAISQSVHIQAVERCPSMTLTALIDPDPLTAHLARRLGVAWYPDVSHAKRSSDLQIVIMATPPNVRSSIISALSEVDTVILCEKPLAHRYRDADDIAARIKGGSAKIVMCHNYFFFDEYTKAREWVVGGEVGDVESLIFEALGTNGLVSGDHNWRRDAALGGGGRFIDSGIHAVYLMEAISESHATEVCALTQYDLGWEVESRAYTIYKMANGSLGVLLFGRGQGGARFEIVGTKGRIIADYPSDTGTLALPPRQIRLLDANGTTQATHPISGTRASAIDCVYDEVIRVREGEATREILSLATALRTLRLVEAAYESAGTGRTVKLGIRSAASRKSFHLGEIE